MIDNLLYTVMGAQDKLQQCALIIGGDSKTICLCIHMYVVLPPGQFLKEGLVDLSLQLSTTALHWTALSHPRIIAY